MISMVDMILLHIKQWLNSLGALKSQEKKIMANRSNSNRSFWAREKKGAMRIGKLLVQATKEISSIPAHGVRELTGQPHDKKPKVGLKKGWFE